MKYCKDCKHGYKIMEHHWGGRIPPLPERLQVRFCLNPDFIQKEDLIEGISSNIRIPCSTMRADGNLCGIEGKGFAAKIKQKKRFWIF